MHPFRLGTETFWLDAETEAQVRRLALTDQSAALALARRSATRQSISVPMMLMDSAAGTIPSPSPAPTRNTVSATMVKIKIGDAEHYVSDAVARHITSLEGQNAALGAVLRGEVKIPPVQPMAKPVADAAMAVCLAAGDAVRSEEARRNDPATPRGKYLQWLSTAYQQLPHTNG